MAIRTHKFFTKALRESAVIMQITDGNLYETANDEVEPDNMPLPYVIVSHLGTQNQVGHKDNGVESDMDTDTITVEIAAESDDALCDIAQLVRDAIRKAVDSFGDEEAEAWGFGITDYQFSTDGVVFDDMKPCFWTRFTYQCETFNK